MLRSAARGQLTPFLRATPRLAIRLSQRTFARTSGLRIDGPPKTPLTSGSSPQTTPPPPIVPKVSQDPPLPTNATPSIPASNIPPPPGSIPPPPKAKRSIFRRRNVVTFLLLSTIAYGGAVWYSFKSDNFHDFFTEYIPGSTICVEAVQDYQFTQRYPGSSPIIKGDRASDLGRKGPHISAIHANRPEVIEKKNEKVTKKNTKEQKGKEVAKSEEEQKGPEIKLAPKTKTPPQTQDEAKKLVENQSPAKRDPKTPTLQADTISTSTDKSRPQPLTPKELITSEQPTIESSQTVAPVLLKIDLLDISPNDAGLEKVTIALNDLIKSFNSTPMYDSTSVSLYEFLKSSVAELNNRLAELISSTRKEADAEIQSQAQYFAKLHQDLQAAVLKERNAMANEWMTAFDRERDLLQERYSERLSEELKKQGEVNDQRLENELLEQAIALRRRWMREIQSQVETERGGRLGKLANLEKALGELTGLHQDSHNIFSKGEKAKKTAIAVQALKDAALHRGGGFIPELAALKSVSNNDELVQAVISSMDPDAYSKGIATQTDLASRFQSLSNELRKISLLPPDAGVAGHAASWLLSKLMFRQKGYVRGDDVDSRLARVEALLEGGELEDATRELNSFTGWGRELSRDWLKEARKRLEVIQAIDVLETQTALEALENV